MTLSDIESHGPTVALLLTGFLWLYRRFRAIETTNKFVQSMATNHLPHIYKTLGKISDKLGIKDEEVPIIYYEGLNGKDTTSDKGRD